MKTTLGALTATQMERARQWRNADIDTLRTPYRITKEMQAAFYRDVVCSRTARSRYFAVHDSRYPGKLAAMVGLENIEWENGRAEIAIIVNPALRGHGTGRRAVHAVLVESFERLRLLQVWGECYECNPAIDFWRSICARLHAEKWVIPYVKFHHGCRYNALGFAFESRVADLKKLLED